jgi:solute carrier family 5 (high affinity choline transporter), member 7
MLGMKLSTAILLSALIVTLYTTLGGMWSVAYTDAFQLGLVALGLVVALPVVFQATGGLASAWATYVAARPAGAGLLPPFHGGSEGWTVPTIINWWDVSLMLMLGGIPWNCCFQRVLSCRTPVRAQQHSILSGLLTIALTAPPLLLGVAAFSYNWPAGLLAELRARPAEALPMIFQYITPAWIGLQDPGGTGRRDHPAGRLAPDVALGSSAAAQKRPRGGRQAAAGIP